MGVNWFVQMFIMCKYNHSCCGVSWVSQGSCVNISMVIVNFTFGFVVIGEKNEEREEDAEEEEETLALPSSADEDADTTASEEHTEL